jgi:TonB family protein
MYRILAILIFVPSIAWAQGKVNPSASIAAAPPLAFIGNAFGSQCPFPESESPGIAWGTTRLRYAVTPDGTVESVTVDMSSGNSALDEAAVQCVSHWRVNSPSKEQTGLQYGSIAWRWTFESSWPHRKVGFGVYQSGYLHDCAMRWRRAGTPLDGTTRMRLIVTPEGLVRDVQVVSSSGYDDLDRAASNCARNWRYKPTLKDGQPVEQQTDAEVVWNVQRIPR